MERVASLCQDTDADVRTLMCSTLYKVLLCAGSSFKPQILDEFLELIDDDEYEVREIAFSKFTLSLPLFAKSLLSFLLVFNFQFF